MSPQLHNCPTTAEQGNRGPQIRGQLRHPHGRFLEVREAANMIAWLASEKNSFTTGGVFDLSGDRATY